ncbi:MAG: DUF4429 domain-containing protein [Propionibacteriaceae bacterium]|jgi:hypothetical protein|nr:DUF4429 domain-containing protein [Propionibacteriaceae bacterium]
METMQVQGTGGWVEYDGQRVSIVRSGVWNTLTGMKGVNTLRLHEISGIRFRRAKRGHGAGFIQFLRVDDPLAKVQNKLLGVYGRKDDIAAAQLDEYAMMFNFRQHAAFVELKELIEHDLGQEPSQIEEPTVALKPEIWRPGSKPPTDFAAFGAEEDDPGVPPAVEMTRPAKAFRPIRAPRSTAPTPQSGWQSEGSATTATADSVADISPIAATANPATPGAAPNRGVPDAAGIIAAIAQLADLRDQGILTESEFSAKKAELLARL